MKWWQWENGVTLICTVVLVLGLYWLSHSWHSLWGLLLMMNIQTLRKKEG